MLHSTRPPFQDYNTPSFIAVFACYILLTNRHNTCYIAAALSYVAPWSKTRWFQMRRRPHQPQNRVQPQNQAGTPTIMINQTPGPSIESVRRPPRRPVPRWPSGSEAARLRLDPSPSHSSDRHHSDRIMTRMIIVIIMSPWLISDDNDSVDDQWQLEYLPVCPLSVTVFVAVGHRDCDESAMRFESHFKSYFGNCKQCKFK